MKAKSKKKHTELRRSQNLTGGGAPMPPLSQIDINVLNTISTSVLTGHPDCEESLVDFRGNYLYLLTYTTLRKYCIKGLS